VEQEEDHLTWEKEEKLSLSSQHDDVQVGQGQEEGQESDREHPCLKKRAKRTLSNPRPMKKRDG
jgi:hypothetical protein